ncbi:MAG: hypothetical protein M1830_003413 [Pleopsidium flavum]|nr:MAG: hypothetical protein M1830_003413 [Pleopsidium flavum]
MVIVETDYIAVGGNRHPAAADWDPVSGLIGFGADRNVALWRPLNDDHGGIHALLSGHTDKVNVVRFFPTGSADCPIIITGSVDKTIRIWRSDPSSPVSFTCVVTLLDHINSINTVAVVPGSDIFASGSADATVKIWRLQIRGESDTEVALVQSIDITPRFFPLALALAPLTTSGSLVLAVGGTRSSVQIYVKDHVRRQGDFSLQATLTGHEGWVRSLSFTEERNRVHGDILLASASQDKYIRLWRVREGEDLPAANTVGHDSAIGTLGKALSNKAHRLKTVTSDYSVTFEALLLGHEDWIYTTSWRTVGSKLQMLSASADNSLAIWESDPTSGVWVCATRLGEISAQKGSTTATGSTGGFWIGLWSSKGQVVSLGRTGSFRLWSHAEQQDRWLQGVAISGHVKEVTGLAWGKDGEYLVSTSSDQTTRLHAEWKRGNRRSWHEFARPQIHGYDLNCIDTIGRSRFISGADEKLLRVFDEPKAVALLLQKLCRIKETAQERMPDAANIPVLGLSNKAVKVVEDGEAIKDADGERSGAVDPASIVHKSTLDLIHPPFEDHLARHTLWPESEKLYGHGYEISAVAASHDGTLVATACRASSINHAVIRLFETCEWREIKPPLTAHSLTVTRLRFSADDQYLLSVGRDRQWAVFGRDHNQLQIYTLAAANPKGHSRMILDAAWGPARGQRIFATAGRDKLTKLWEAAGEDFLCKATVPALHSVTAVAFLPLIHHETLYVASGTDNGSISINGFTKGDFTISVVCIFDARICPSKSVTQLSWRPSTGRPGMSQVNQDDGSGKNGKHAFELGVASEDASLRIYSIYNLDA